MLIIYECCVSHKLGRKLNSNKDGSNKETSWRDCFQKCGQGKWDTPNIAKMASCCIYLAYGQRKRIQLLSRSCSQSHRFDAKGERNQTSVHFLLQPSNLNPIPSTGHNQLEGHWWRSTQNTVYRSQPTLQGTQQGRQESGKLIWQEAGN